MDAKIARPDHEIHEPLARRWSPYAYADRDVSDDDLRALFEAARWAPSSYNEQPWRYLVARRREGDAFERMLSCLVEANRAWARDAPVLAIGVVMRTFRRNEKPNRAAEHDLGLASGNLCVEATVRGLFVHQMIGILPDRVREHYGLPGHADALTGLAIGHRADPASLPEKLRERDEAPRERRPLADFVFAAGWEEPAAFVQTAKG